MALIFCALLLPPFGDARESSFFEDYASRFSSQADEVSMDIIAIPGGRIIWEQRAGEPLVSASLVKILTSYAALKTLGPRHRFETHIFAAQKPSGGTLSGNIWIKSNGDMFLTHEKIADLAFQLKTTGINRITGGIIVDNHYFDPPVQQLCLNGDDCRQTYNPVVSGTAIDYNRITFHVTPGGKPGVPAKVKWLPEGGYVEMTNQSGTVKGRPKENLHLRSLGVGEDGRERFQLRGQVSQASRETLEVCLNVGNPWAFLGHSLKKSLQDAGVQVAGGIHQGRTPPDASRIMTYESDPLEEMLFGLNRYSNNFMAEMLLRAMGAHAHGEPGTREKGIRVVQARLQEMGVEAGDFSLFGGSGLSRDCRVSARVFSKILLDAHHDIQDGPKFIDSLAINGQDGTLRRRLKDSFVTLRGKTGSLKDVVAFSGYVSAPGQGIYAVTILLNKVKDSVKARDSLYKFLEELPYKVSLRVSSRMQ